MQTQVIQYTESNYGFWAIKDCLCKSNSNIEYKLIHDENLGSGGESLVYKCKRVHDGKEFAIKYFINERINNYNTKEHEEKCNLVKVLSNRCNMVSILDFGIIDITYNSNSEVKVDSFYFEIMPIYDCDLSTKKLSYEEIKHNLLPDILKALNELHNNNYVHKDINPKNIYIRGSSYYLGDTGIMRKIDPKLGGYGQTSSIAGTLGYIAPEVNDHYFSFSSDYYSLGCTLAYSYLGHHPYQNEIENNRPIYLLVKQFGMSIEANESENDLQVLIDHLCDENEENRPGHDDVNLWIKNPSEFIKKYKNIASSNYYTYTFKGVEYHNPEDLAIAMSDNFEEAMSHMQGGINGSPLFAYLNYNQDLKAEAVDIYLKDIGDSVSKENREIVLSKILFLMNNKKEFIFKNIRFKSLIELTTLSDNAILPIMKSSYISWVLSQISGIEKSKVESFAQLEDISKYNPTVAIGIIKNLKIAERISQKSNIIMEYFRHNGYKFFYHLMDDDFIDNNIELWSYIFYSGYSEIVHEYHTNHLEEDDVKKYIFLFEALEKIDNKNCRYYREVFNLHGPFSHILWFIDNIDIYKFNTAKSIELKKYIVNKDLSDRDEISKQIKDFQDLKIPYDAIINSANLDIFTNLSRKNEIAILNSDGLITQFKDMMVPAGFKNSFTVTARFYKRLMDDCFKILGVDDDIFKDHYFYPITDNPISGEKYSDQMYNFKSLNIPKEKFTIEWKKDDGQWIKNKGPEGILLTKDGFVSIMPFVNANEYTFRITNGEPEFIGSNRNSKFVSSKNIDLTIDCAYQKMPKSGEGYLIDKKNKTITALEGYEISVSNKEYTPIGDDNKYMQNGTYYVRKAEDINHEASRWLEISPCSM